MTPTVPPSSTTRRIALICTAVVAVLIALVSLAPPPEIPGPPGNDKLGHAIAYALLILPIATLAPRFLVWAVPSALVYGGVIELIQPSFGRSCEALDMVADAVGVLIGLILGYGVHRLRKAAGLTRPNK